MRPSWETSDQSYCRQVAATLEGAVMLPELRDAQIAFGREFHDCRR
jgi:hypothetical protein